MTNPVKITILLFLTVIGLNAHEHWLYTDAPVYSPGDSIQVHLRSGHLGGASEFLINSQLIQVASLVDPDGHETPLNMQPVNNEHTCSFLPQRFGEYTILVKLRKRNKGPYSYLLKTLVQVGSIANTTAYTPNQELEILPGGPPNTLRVMTAGEPVKVPISLTSEGGVGRSLSMDRHGVSSISPNHQGFSIAICHFRRQTASYSFYLGD
ncbi:MAG: DUF4198 domain-containing protein [Candidatus Marinimicrobia bacterium]|nr:DUF4198 domain-containing protein [Candidatus Neomarinimicrobiota bacterium]